MEHFNCEEEVIGYILEEVVVQGGFGVVVFCPNASVCEQLDLALQEAIDELDEPNFPFDKVLITDRKPTQLRNPRKHIVYTPR